MISLNDSIQIFLSEKNTYYSLWVFYFTSSAAVLGFIYGGTNNSQLINTIVTTVLYFVIVLGNSNAIFSTQTSLKTIEIEMQSAIKINKQNNTNGSSNINASNIVAKFKITKLSEVKFHYWLGTILVFFGIWFPYLLNALKNGFARTIT